MVAFVPSPSASQVPEERPRVEDAMGAFDAERDRATATERLLDDVEAALSRLDAGTYGTCEACGEAIDAERLAISPTVRTCERHPQLTDPS